MKSQRVRIGLVGCGSIAQIMHLPALSSLHDMFRIEAVCDVCESVLSAVADRYGIAKRYSEYQELIEDREIDAVAVLNRQHAEVAIAAARKNKHVFIEKPLCFNMTEAQEIAAAVNEANVVAMVGYMRLYDPSYHHLLSEIQSLQDIRLIRVHDFGSRYPLDDIYDVAQPSEVERQRLSRLAADLKESLRAVVGPRQQVIEAYYQLLHLTTHDASVLRSLFGLPKKILACKIWRGGFCTTCLMELRGVPCIWETGGFDYTRNWWDQNLTVYDSAKTVSIEYEYPYMRNARSVLCVRRNEMRAQVDSAIMGGYEDAYRAEWVNLFNAIANGKPVVSGIEGAVEDIQFMIDIVEAAKQNIKENEEKVQA